MVIQETYDQGKAGGDWSSMSCLGVKSLQQRDRTKYVHSVVSFLSLSLSHSLIKERAEWKGKAQNSLNLHQTLVLSLASFIRHQRRPGSKIRLQLCKLLSPVGYSGVQRWSPCPSGGRRNLLVWVALVMPHGCYLILRYHISAYKQALLLKEGHFRGWELLHQEWRGFQGPSFVSHTEEGSIACEGLSQPGPWVTSARGWFVTRATPLLN